MLDKSISISDIVIMNMRCHNKNNESKQRADCLISDSGIATIPEQAIRPFKKIPLTQGMFALVDDEDFKELSKHKWHIRKKKYTFYARARIEIDGNRKLVYMHRIIMDAPKDRQIDHKNGDGLDNQRSNLRFCTNGQNQHNRRKGKGTSKYKGVHWLKDNKRWRASIGFNKKLINLGCYDNETDAAKAYDRKALELFGEFARTNFKESDNET